MNDSQERPSFCPDFHCHSTASDGSLAPDEVVQRAVEQGVTALALTDHDTHEGYDRVCASEGLTMISGIELSCIWRGKTIHVVGLDFDPQHEVMRKAVARQQENRWRRAEMIAERLSRAGLPNVLPEAKALAGGVPGRPHFAQALVKAGSVRDSAHAFKRYLGTGKTGDVTAFWPPLEEIIDWIRQSGGVAVLAHPRKYRMTGAKLRELLGDFMAAGGEAMEVLTSGQSDADTRFLKLLSDQFGCAASLGSDFHSPGNHWCELGRLPRLPLGAEPVWERFSTATQKRMGLSLA